MTEKNMSGYSSHFKTLLNMSWITNIYASKGLHLVTSLFISENFKNWKWKQLSYLYMCGCMLLQSALFLSIIQDEI